MGERIRALGEPVKFTSFMPSAADAVAERGHVWLAAVEGAIQLLGGLRDVVADRRRASELVRRERADLYPGDVDYERVINEFSPTASEPDAARRAAPDGISDPASGKKWSADPNRPPVESRSPGASRTPTESIARDRSSWGTRLQYAEPEALASRFSEVARREGITMKEATPEQRDRIGRLVGESSVPLYGYAAQEAERLGGRDRYVMLREVARTNRLSLDRVNDRKQAEHLLWNTVGGTVETALCFDEALHALCMSEKLSFSEPADRAQATRLLAARRVDLVSEYGWGRREARPQTFEETLSDAERGERFEQEIVRRLREQDLPDTATNRGAAARHIAEVRPDLLPTYDLKRERR